MLNKEVYTSKNYRFECRYSRLGKKRLFATRNFSEIIAFPIKVIRG